MTSLNCTTGILDTIVPVATDGVVVPLASHPPETALQAVPTLVTVLVWLSLESTRHRQGAVASVRMAFRTLASIAGGATAVLAWRVSELLECDGHVSGRAWHVLVSIATLVGTLVLVGPLAARAPRLAILVALATAACTVVADVGLRGWWTTSHAAIPLVAVQQLWCTVAALMLAALPPPSLRRIDVSRRAASSSSVSVVDALARRAPNAPACAPASHLWSW